MTAVHQLLPVFSPGDAIGGAVREMRRMLRELGFRSEVYADLIDQRLQRESRPASRLLEEATSEDVVLYHLSIGSPVARLLELTRARRVIVYHNITPPEYFRATSPRVTYWLERGRDDLQRVAPKVDLCIADSTYNLAEALAAGAPRGWVVPPPVEWDRRRPEPARPTQPPTILFVSRLALSKRQDDLIRFLAAVRAGPVPDARLVLAGTGDDNSGYVAGLRRLAQALGVESAVDIPGRRVDDDDLRRRYMSASVFACASEHEGFCMPLLEAMAFEVPIVAYASTAVPDTLGGAGITLDHKDPLVWGEVLGRVIRDQPLRQQLIISGRHRLVDFSQSAIRQRLADALAQIAVAPHPGAGVSAGA